MDIREYQIAKVMGGVSFDAIVDNRWEDIYERVRPAIRSSSTSTESPLEIKVQIGHEGLLLSYVLQDVLRKIGVSRESLTFDVGRFPITEGAPKDVGRVMENILAVLQRRDWNTIGTMFSFAIPAKEGDSQFAIEYFKHELGLFPRLLSSAFPSDGMDVVNLAFKGNEGDARHELNIYNTIEQHIVISYDTKVTRAKSNTYDIPTFIDQMFGQFVTRLGKPLVDILTDTNLGAHMDLDFLRKGTREDRTNGLDG